MKRTTCAIAASVVALGSALPALADCREELAAVDAAMAVNVQLEGEPLNYLLALRERAGALCDAGDESGATAPVNELKSLTGLIPVPVLEGLQRSPTMSLHRPCVLAAVLSIAIPPACVGTRSESAPTGATSAEWRAGVLQHLAEREYRASENGSGLQAPNRAHNLRTYFDASGIRVHDRTASGSPELVRLSLARVGRGEALRAVASGEVVAREHRVEIRRQGLVEWYENSPAGLEQGFTLAERPNGEGPLIVELTLAGARPSLHGDALILESSSRKLRYGHLLATDDSQQSLAARFEVPNADRLRIVVDDGAATYPVVIDPLITETADSELESDQVDAKLGWSVAGAGDVNGDGYADVIVGADRYDNGQTDEGAAFVFHGSASGIADANPGSAATQIESDQASAQLGFSVAGAGDVNGDGYADVIVGAPVYDNGQAAEGVALVFHGSASGIADGNPATAPTRIESDQVGGVAGSSVSGAGDVNGDGYGDVIVGAGYYDDGQTDEGAAFVFNGSATGLVGAGNPGNANGTIEGNQANAWLGISVAGAGDLNGDGYADVIAGADQYDNGQTDEGVAVVCYGAASGIVQPAAPLLCGATIESNQASALLGRSVAGAGDVDGDGYADLIVGAYLYDAGSTDEGAAFVFRGAPGGVVVSGSPSNADAQLESDQPNALFGYSVAGAGDVNGDGFADVIVGAQIYTNGEGNEGAAFVFQGFIVDGIIDSNPSTALALLESNQASAFLGGGVAGAGDVNGDGYGDVLVGAPQYSDGQSQEGAAFVYRGGAFGVYFEYPGARHFFSFDQSNQGAAQFGASVASAGDLNNDGFGDVIVGAPFYDNGQADEGAAFVFTGYTYGVSCCDLSSANSILESNQASARFGWSVAGLGDVNGDGYGDVIVGAYAYDSGQSEEGAAFVFHGSASGIAAAGHPGNANATLEANQADAVFGYSVAGAGDVNGDGYADVIVEAYLYDDGQTDEGAAFVFHGSSSGVVAAGNPGNANAKLEPDQANAQLTSAAGAGDVNGDGYADVIVGAYLNDSGQTDEGAAFVFHGSATGLVASGNPGNANATIEGNQAGAGLGNSVAGAGDVNGDGYADVIVGAYTYDDGETDEGVASLFYGTGTGLVQPASPTTSNATLQSNQAGAGFGISVAGAGDVNGDGYADVIIGAYAYDDPESDEGAAFVFHGGAGGIAVSGSPSNADAQFEGDQAGAWLGFSVASAGDNNGDGFADVIVGIRFYDFGQTDEGIVEVFPGNGAGSGDYVFPQQLRLTSDTPIQPWGRTHAASHFRVRMVANDPRGLGRVKLRIEYCPPGVPFGHASCGSKTSASWTLGPTTLTEVVSGLTNNTNYRWRARVLRAPPTGTVPIVPAHGPWRRFGAQASEADLRTLPEPGLALSLASSLALIGLLARRHAIRSGWR